MNNSNNPGMIQPFTIVTAPYIDLTGEYKKYQTGDTQRGLFIVVRSDNFGNALAFKITSQQNKFLNEFSYVLRRTSHQFLMTDSYIQFDKWHTLDVRECVKLGEVASSTRMALLRRYDAIIRTVDNAMKDNIVIGSDNPISYVSPNIKSKI